MTMLPITIDELRADHGPSSFPTFEQIGRQRAQFQASLQSIQQFTIDTGTGGYVVEYQDAPTDGELVDRIDHLETKNFGLTVELADAKRELRAAEILVECQRIAEKRLRAELDVLRAQNRSMTDKLLGLAGKRPAPGGALDDPKPTSIMFGEPLVPRRQAAREEIACL